MKKLIPMITMIFLVVLIFVLAQITLSHLHKNKILKEVITRLEADSRIAQVVVTKSVKNEETKKIMTTIKFLEFDVNGNPLTPKFFSFSDNLIQFQSLVMRFDDIYVKEADTLRGKSVYLFWKAFMLDGQNTEEYEITKLNEIPEGYEVDRSRTPYEQAIWKTFWQDALDSTIARKKGIKNAQIEAPGTKFLPGRVYVIKIEHDGGIRIDSAPIPEILKK